MGKTVELSQLAFLQNFSTEFSTLGDDYVFTRITESDRRPGDFSGGPVRFDGMSWLLCFGGRLDIEVNLSRQKSQALPHLFHFLERRRSYEKPPLHPRL